MSADLGAAETASLKNGLLDLDIPIDGLVLIEIPK
jgi:hypothetical protein